MSSLKQLLSIAAKQVGYKEGSNNNSKYGAWYGLNNQPWCAMFISWCANQAGISTQIIPRFAYVPYGISFFQERKAYFPRGTYTPVPGDIIFFGNSDHVGIVESVSKGTVISIEGNTSASGGSNGDGVYRRSRSLNNSWIKGYGHPNYPQDKKIKEEETVEIKNINIRDLDQDSLISVSAVNVNGTNYIRLRDTEKLFPIQVSFDEKEFVPTIRRA